MNEINVTIGEAEKQVHLASLVRKLEQNKDFRELILEGYFRDNASRLVMLKADKEFQTEDKQKSIDKDILGISVFGDFLRTVKIMGDMAQEAMEAHERTREDILAEAV